MPPLASNICSHSVNGVRKKAREASLERLRGQATQEPTAIVLTTGVERKNWIVDTATAPLHMEVGRGGAKD